MTTKTPYVHTSSGPPLGTVLEPQTASYQIHRPNASGADGIKADVGHHAWDIPSSDHQLREPAPRQGHSRFYEGLPSEIHRTAQPLPPQAQSSSQHLSATDLVSQDQYPSSTHAGISAPVRPAEPDFDAGLSDTYAAPAHTSPAAAAVPRASSSPSETDGAGVGSVTRITATQVNEQIQERKQEDELEVRRKEAEAIERAVEEEQARERRRVRGLGNEDLDAMIRGMQKRHPEAKLDLNPALDEEFTLDKFRSQLERFYSSIIFGMMRLGKEVLRIRNWEDGGRRTRVALAVYAVAWATGLIFATIFGFISVLVLEPRSRSYCFGPPSHVVRARVNASDPGSGKPISLDKKDLEILEATPIPWGPAASERQAAAWAKNIENALLSLMTPGKKGGKQADKAQEKVEEEVNGVLVRNMEKRQGGAEDGEDEDKEGNMSRKEKREIAEEVYGKPAMQMIGGLADKWERIGNAINPTPPFVKPSRGRLFFVILLPALTLAIFITPKMVSRALGFVIGFTLFGKPVIDPVVAELDRRIPHWRQRLILEHNILADVPTNPQLIIRLLRQAEHKNHPIAFAEPIKDNNTDVMQGSEDSEDKGTMAKIGAMETKMVESTRTKARKTWDKLGELKEEGFAWLSGRKKVNFEGKAKNTMDKLRVSQDSKPAAALLRKLPDGSGDPYDIPEGPARFYVKHTKHGLGHIIIHPPILSAERGVQILTPARITFTTIRQVAPDRNTPIDPDTKASGKQDLTISIDDIIQMKKTGLGKIAKLAVGWVLDVDGGGGTGLDLTIIRRDVPSGGNRQGVAEEVHLTGIVRRDELFERLLTIGDQRWELL